MKLHNRIDANLQIQGCNERNSCGISAPNLLPLCRWILRIVGPPRIVFVPIIQRIEFMTVLSTGLKGGYNWVKFLLILFGSYVFKKSHFQSKCNRKPYAKSSRIWLNATIGFGNYISDYQKSDKSWMKKQFKATLNLNT